MKPLFLLHFLAVRSDGGGFEIICVKELQIKERENNNSREIFILIQTNISRVISCSSEYSAVRSENRPDIVELQ